MKQMILTILMSLPALGLMAQKNSTQAEFQLIRSATLVINYAGYKILVDPMLSPKGALGSIAGTNSSPMTDLPFPVSTILDDVDVVLVTHTHGDHFDSVAAEVLSFMLLIPPQAAFMALGVPSSPYVAMINTGCG